MTKCTAKSLLKTPAICEPLVTVLAQVPDKRSDRGKRFALHFILCIVLLGFIKGKKSIEGCVHFAHARKKWLARYFDLEHGVPNATTICRAVAVTLPRDVIRVINYFVSVIDGVIIEKGVSMDGKTVKAISELKEGCNHFISLFSHATCHILDQEGVTRKENEITASPRLLERNCLFKTMLTADAMFTQRAVTTAIRSSGADYLLIVKGNHTDLEDIFKPTFTDPVASVTTQSFHDNRADRSCTTTISLTADVDLADLHRQGWADISLIGKLTRTGTRITKRTETAVNETIFFITSRKDITPEQAHGFIRSHWHIENKLHWQKDVTWSEDRSRARVGNTQAILSYLRSFALECIRRKYTSVTKAIETFTEKPSHYFCLLSTLQIV